MWKKIKKFILQAFKFAIECVFYVCFLVVTMAFTKELWISSLLLMVVLIIYVFLDASVDNIG